MKKAEKILAVISLMALVIKMLLIPGAGALLVISLMSLSWLYILFGFLILNNIRLRNAFNKTAYEGISAWKIIGTIAGGVTYSCLIAGILFWLQFWPGTIFLLWMGVILLIPVIIVAVIQNSKIKSQFYKNIFIRSAIIGGIAVILLTYILKEPYINIVYRKYPSYRDALHQLRSDPGNKEFQLKEEEERYKMEEEKRKN